MTDADRPTRPPELWDDLSLPPGMLSLGFAALEHAPLEGDESLPHRDLVRHGRRRGAAGAMPGRATIGSVRNALLDLWPVIRCRLRAIALAAAGVVAIALVAEGIRALI